MIITQANLDQLRVTFEARFQEGYSSAELALGKLYFDVPSSTRSNRYGWIAQQLGLREWIGARVAQNLSEHEYTLVNKPYEGTVEVDKFDIEDDNLGLYTGVHMPQLGEAVKKHPEILAADLLVANPTAFDGLSFFNDAHPCFDAGGSTYDNNHTLALNATNLNTMLSLASQIKGEDGRPLGVRYTHLVVPPVLEFPAKQILKSATYASLIAGEGTGAVRIDNQMQGVLDIIVAPYLSAVNVYYLADLSKGIKPLVHQTRSRPLFVSRDNVQDPKVFDLRKFTYGVELRDNMGVSLPFLMARSTF
jgi:phage major head subunit gpT-like protein